MYEHGMEDDDFIFQVLDQAVFNHPEFVGLSYDSEKHRYMIISRWEKFFIFPGVVSDHNFDKTEVSSEIINNRHFAFQIERDGVSTIAYNAKELNQRILELLENSGMYRKSLLLSYEYKSQHHS